MKERIVSFEIGPNPPKRLDKALARDVPEDAALSRSRLAKLLEAGSVQVDGAVVVQPRIQISEGALVRISVQEAEDSHIEGENIPLSVVFEDDDLIVLRGRANFPMSAQLFKTTEGHILLLGIAVTLVGLIVMGVVAIGSPTTSHMIGVMSFTNIIFGRAVSMSIGYAAGYEHALVVPVNDWVRDEVRAHLSRD